MVKDKSLDIINIDGKSYKKIDFQLETEFEEHILHQINKIFPDQIAIEFKMTLKTESLYSNDVRTDLIFISNKYSVPINHTLYRTSKRINMFIINAICRKRKL